MHKSRVVQAAIRECKFEQLNHPPYSSDLAPSDYYVSKFEVPLAWNVISGRWWAQGCYRGLIWGPNRRLLFQRHRLLKRKVGQMRWSKGGLYWKIMLKPSSNLWVKPRVLRTYWTPLVYKLLTGSRQFSPLSCRPVFVHVFSTAPANSPSWISEFGRMTLEMISWSIPTKFKWPRWDSTPGSTVRYATDCAMMSNLVGVPESSIFSRKLYKT